MPTTQPVESGEIRLIQTAQQGDESAFGLLFERHFEAVYNFAIWKTQDPALAEDITQEAFIRGHRSLDRLGPPYKFRAWMFRLVHNLYIDHYRKVNRYEETEVKEWFPGSDPTPEREIVADEEALRVRNAVNLLPEVHREALILREFHGMDYNDIANVMDVSVDYVGVLLHRARAKFKDAYGVAILMEDPLPPCDELAELLDILHDGGPLADGDYRTIEKHLKRCPTCQQRQRELLMVAGMIPLLPTFEPPAGLRHGVMEGIRTSGDVALTQPNLPKATRVHQKAAADSDGQATKSIIGKAAVIVSGGLLALLALVGLGATLLTMSGDPASEGTPPPDAAPAVVCGDGVCTPDEEDEATCPLDCAFTPAEQPIEQDAPPLDAPTQAPQGDAIQPTDAPISTGPTCGNGLCEDGENTDTCLADCDCVDDGVCGPGEGSTCRDCSTDPAAQCGVPCDGACSGGLSCAGGVCWDNAICGGGDDGGTTDGGGTGDGGSDDSSEGTDDGSACTCECVEAAPGVFRCTDTCTGAVCDP